MLTKAAQFLGLDACFGAGTPILTADGAVAIDRLRDGDEVLSRDEHDSSGLKETETTRGSVAKVSSAVFRSPFPLNESFPTET